MYLLDGIPVPVEDEHEVLAMRSKLQLQVLLLVVQEESLNHLIIPKFKEGLPRLAPLGGWVSEVGSRNPDDEILTGTNKRKLDRIMINRLSFPGALD